MSPNRASGPQNHPRENVAVSVIAGAARSIGGTGGRLIAPFFFSAAATPSQAGRSPAELSPAYPRNFMKDLLLIDWKKLSFLKRSMFFNISTISCDTRGEIVTRLA